MTSDFSFKNPVFAQFAFYAGIVILKTLAMSLATAYHRITKKVFINPEDNPGGKVTPNDPDVERIRRCHLNDLENVVPFVLIGGLYVLTGPSAHAAALHFRIFAAARIFHTISYLFALPQPCRALSFVVGYMATASMAVNVIRSGVM
ncbi:microsomal glutathione S-transferase 1-like isoform X2 [Liolophura sinensis]|uniref:microsomal glutathione S-transferase 1-like isoform X2 n=1 Tax=Liolophura sinensis TaxID=3198878 RepID=UPI003158565E